MENQSLAEPEGVQLPKEPQLLENKPCCSKLTSILLGFLLFLLGGLAVFAYFSFLPSEKTKPEVMPTTAPLVKQPSPTPLPSIEKNGTIEQKSEVIIPKALLEASDWREKDFPNLGLSLKIPSSWEEQSGAAKDVNFLINPGTTLPTSFRISLLDNPQNYGRRDFVWKTILGYTISLEEGIKQKYVEAPREWLIDGAESLSLRLLEYSMGGDYLVIPRENKMLVLFLSQSEFSEKNPEVFTVLSTINLK